MDEATVEFITHSLIHGAERFLRSCQLCSYSRTSQHFMEPGGSLPCSQKPSTGPYPEPDQSKIHKIATKFSLIKSVLLPFLEETWVVSVQKLEITVPVPGLTATETESMRPLASHPTRYRPMEKTDAIRIKNGEGVLFNKDSKQECN
jgi:hypothetical protein